MFMVAGVVVAPLSLVYYHCMKEISLSLALRLCYALDFLKSGSYTVLSMQGGKRVQWKRMVFNVFEVDI